MELLQQENQPRKAAHPKGSAADIGREYRERETVEYLLAQLRRIKGKSLRRQRWARLVKQIEKRGGMV